MTIILNAIAHLPASDKVQLMGILCTSILSVVSVVIAICTLRQNSKMIQESTRPYVIMTYEVINNGSPNTFFVIKNYGATGSRITKFDYDFEPDADLKSQLDRIVGTYLAPGQKKLYFFKNSNINSDCVEFTIEYSSGLKHYADVIPLKIKTGALSLRTDNKNSISYSLQELVERHF